MRAAPLFAYLLEGPPHVSYVGLASRPAQRLEAHNRTAGHSCSNKRTRRYAGQWRLTLVIGYFCVLCEGAHLPFFRGAALFTRLWRLQARQQADVSPRLHGLRLVRHCAVRGLGVFASDVESAQRLLQTVWLRRARPAGAARMCATARD